MITLFLTIIAGFLAFYLAIPAMMFILAIPMMLWYLTIGIIGITVTIFVELLSGFVGLFGVKWPREPFVFKLDDRKSDDYYEDHNY